MKRSIAIVIALVACTPKPDPTTFAADWLRDLATGQTQTAYERLCSDAQGQLASMAQASTGEAPEVFLARLKGRYGGVDKIEVLNADGDFIDLEVVTSQANLPMRLKRIGSSFCVSLPKP
jgi:hypothetical protein